MESDDRAPTRAGRIETIGLRHAHADAATVAEFLSRTGYQLPVALADLIDNAIDADATHVHIGLVLREGRPAMIAIGDNGRGMSPAQLERAVSLEKDPSKQDGKSLGRYGAGLKAASFSLGRILTIATRAQGSEPVGAVIEQELYRDNYEYKVMARASASALLQATWGGRALTPTGTLVLVSGITSMVPESDTSQDLFLSNFGKDLDTRLGLVFHRYLADGRIEITKATRSLESGAPEFNMYNLRPVDPFGYPSSGDPRYPRRVDVDTGTSRVPVTLHLWPKQGRTKATRHEFYEILGRSGEWQGLYFYRWDRLLQAGGWNGLRSQEPHMSYARIAVDLPPGSDDEFRPTVMKDRIENPRPLLQALMRQPAWAEYVASSSRIYRDSSDGNGAPAASSGASATLARPAYVPLRGRPSVRLRGTSSLELDDGVVERLGPLDASAVADLAWAALAPIAVKQRVSPEERARMSKVEQAVARLAGRANT